MRKITLVFGLLLVSCWSTTAQEEYDNFILDPSFSRSYVSGVIPIENLSLSYTDMVYGDSIVIQKSSHELGFGSAIALSNKASALRYTETRPRHIDSTGLRADARNIFFVPDGMVIVTYNKYMRKWNIRFSDQMVGTTYRAHVPARIFVVKNPEEEFREISRAYQTAN